MAPSYTLKTSMIIIICLAVFLSVLLTGVLPHIQAVNAAQPSDPNEAQLRAGMNFIKTQVYTEQEDQDILKAFNFCSRLDRGFKFNQRIINIIRDFKSLFEFPFNKLSYKKITVNNKVPVNGIIEFLVVVSQFNIASVKNGNNIILMDLACVFNPAVAL